MKADTPTDRWAGRLGEYQGGLEVGGCIENAGVLEGAAAFGWLLVLTIK